MQYVRLADVPILMTAAQKHPKVGAAAVICPLAVDALLPCDIVGIAVQISVPVTLFQTLLHEQCSSAHSWGRLLVSFMLQAS